VGITVRFAHALGPQTHAAETTVAETGDIAALLEALARRYGEGFRRRVLNEDGTVKHLVDVYVNGRACAASLQTQLKYGDVVLILPKPWQPSVPSALGCRPAHRSAFTAGTCA
jgi:molybdopterin converting factor small subunit